MSWHESWSQESGGDKPLPEVIRDLLEEDEQVLWHGQPQRRLSLTGIDLFLIPFGLLFVAVVVGAAVAGPGPQNNPIMVWLFTLLAGSVGLYAAFGRLFHQLAWRRCTHYAVTDRRVLLVAGNRKPIVASFELDQLGHLRLSQGKGGRGTIRFQRFPGEAFNPLGGSAEQIDPRWPTRALVDIPDARAVYDLIRQARRKWLRRLLGPDAETFPP